MIRQLQIANFRNYSNLRLVIPNEHRIVVFYGDNGSGKTNILEAISLFFASNGLRKSKYEEMINNRLENNYWRVSLETEENMYSTAYLKNSQSAKKIYKINDKNVRNLNDFKKEYYLIWMTYETDRLFLGSPADRRNFIDMFCNVIFPLHEGKLKDYEKLTRERLKILKKYCEFGFSKDIINWLDIIETKIATLGLEIASNRINISQIIEKNQLTKECFPSYNSSMQGNLESLLLKENQDSVLKVYQDELRNRRQKDGFSGSTTFGPNRSDWIVFHNEKHIEAASCSAGEQKLLLTDVFLSFIVYNIQHDNRKLILLLDDIIAHLDSAHKGLIFKYIGNFVNNTAREVLIFLTGVNRALFSELDSNASFYNVNNGNVGLG